MFSHPLHEEDTKIRVLSTSLIFLFAKLKRRRKRRKGEEEEDRDLGDKEELHKGSKVERHDTTRHARSRFLAEGKEKSPYVDIKYTEQMRVQM